MRIHLTRKYLVVVMTMISALAFWAGCASIRPQVEPNLAFVQQDTLAGDSTVFTLDELDPAVIFSDSETRTIDPSFYRFLDDQFRLGGTNWINVQLSQGAMRDNRFQSYTAVDISWGVWITDRVRIDFQSGGAYTPLQARDALSQSIDGGLTLLSMSGRGNFLISPSFAFMGQYIFLGTGVDFMLWKYQDYQRTASSRVVLNSYDQLFGLEIYGGVGWNLFQTRAFRVGFEVTPGAVFWGPSTTSGYTNNLFDPFYYLKLGILVKIQVKENTEGAVTEPSGRYGRFE